MLQGEDLARGWVGREYSDELRMGARLIQFANVMLPEGSIRYEGDNGMAVVTSVLALMAMGLKVFRGIHYLAGNCLTEPALMLLRPLSEVLAGLGYIAADRSRVGERAEMYLAGELIEYYQWVKKLIKEGAIEHLSPDTLANPESLLDALKQRLIEVETEKSGLEGAEAEVEAKLRRMLSRHGWADVSLEVMLKEAQARLAYPLVFKWAAGVLHARKPGMYVDIDENGNIITRFGVSPSNLGYTLAYANLLFAAILRSVNSIFKLGLDTSISVFMEEIDQKAKKRRTKTIRPGESGSSDHPPLICGPGEHTL